MKRNLFLFNPIDDMTTDPDIAKEKAKETRSNLPR